MLAFFLVQILFSFSSAVFAVPWVFIDMHEWKIKFATFLKWPYWLFYFTNVYEGKGINTFVLVDSTGSLCESLFSFCYQLFVIVQCQSMSIQRWLWRWPVNNKITVIIIINWIIMHWCNGSLESSFHGSSNVHAFTEVVQLSSESAQAIVCLSEMELNYTNPMLLCDSSVDLVVVYGFVWWWNEWHRWCHYLLILNTIISHLI